MSTQLRDHLDLETKLDRVERRSRQDRRATFNNLGHVLDLDLLRRCYHDLDGSKAVGIDGVTKADYGEKLEERLKELLLRIRRGSYHPKPSRIVEIPKADGSMRPLAISCLEDKIVQEAARTILERIYEPTFLEVSHGFRPGRGCQTALLDLHRHLMAWDTGAVLEIDLRKCFDTIPHEPMERLLRLKIQDERFLHLILKLLKAPVWGDGKPRRNERGTPQGSILSPLVANVFLHYVMDLWFSWMNAQEYGGRARLVRYADDAVFVFPSQEQAERFHRQLAERLARFGLSLHKDKTQVLPSGRREAIRFCRQGRRLPGFTFLGFLHVWGISWNRNRGVRFWRVKRRTCPIRFRRKIAEIRDYVRRHRHDPELLERTRRVMMGYLNYFAINDNQRRVQQFLRQMRRVLFFYLNRRSQRRSYTWAEFDAIYSRAELPTYYATRNLFFHSRSQGNAPVSS